MEQNNRGNRYTPEVRARAVRMVLDNQGDFASQSAAIKSIAPKIGCGIDTLRNWVRQSETDTGFRDGVTASERARLKALERENRQLRQANEILRKASAYFAQAERAQNHGARFGNDCLYQRISRGLRGRADLQGSADCPFHILCASGCRA